MKLPRLLSLGLVLAFARTAPAATPPAGEPIKLGEFGSLTGKEAAFGQAAHRGTLFGIETVNARGGVLGRPLQLITEDTQSKPGEAATAVKKLISRDRVVAVLSGATSTGAIEGAALSQAARIPLLASTATNPRVTELGDHVFRVCFIDPFQGAVLARFARETLKTPRVALLVSVSAPYSVGLARVFRERFTAAGGSIAAEQKYTEGDKDFRAQLTAIKAAGADALFVPGYYTEAALVCRQARELGFTGPIFGGDAWESPTLLSLGGPAVEGVYFTSHYSSENTDPAVQDFVRRYRARFDGETPDAVAALGYDAALLLADALARTASAEPAQIRTALAATRDFPGVTGLTSIDPQRNAAKSAVILTVQAGRFQFVQNLAP